jgi:hypothetical protein
MSNKVGYGAGGVDFANYFPAYEVSEKTLYSVSTDQKFTVELSKNVNNTTNYVSIIQPFYSDGTYNQFLLSRDIKQFTIYAKNATSYKVWMDSNVTISSITLILWCVTFYTYETEQAYVSSITNSNYTVNNVSYDLCNYFPQFAVHSNDENSSTGDIYINNSLSTKNSTLTTYLNFGSVTNAAATGIQNGASFGKIMYLEFNGAKEAGNFSIRFSKYSATTITLNTITMYLPTSTDNTLVFSDYNVNGVDLDKIFPRCETFVLTMTGKADNREYTFSLNKNTRSTTNYVVLTSFSYHTLSGTDGTYNIFAASNLAGMPIIRGKSASSFIISIRTEKNDNWNGKMNLLVIYL